MAIYFHICKSNSHERFEPLPTFRYKSAEYESISRTNMEARPWPMMTAVASTGGHDGYHHRPGSFERKWIRVGYIVPHDISVSAERSLSGPRHACCTCHVPTYLRIGSEPHICSSKVERPVVHRCTASDTIERDQKKYKK